MANENEIMRAQIKVEADTKDARDQIQAAMDDVKKSADDAGGAAGAAAKKAEDAASTAGEGFASAATKAAVWLAAIQALDKGLGMLAEGVKAYQTASDVAAGRGDPFSPARIGNAKERLSALSKEIEDARKKVQEQSGKSDNVLNDPLSLLWNGGKTGYQKALEELERLESEAGKTRTAMHNAERLAEQQAQQNADAKRAASLEDRIERERIATLEGVQRIEAEKQVALKKAREQYGDGEDTGALLRAITVRYDREVSEFEEAERKKAKAEADRIAERERREQEARERDAKHAQDVANRIAETAARAMASAMKGVSDEWNRSQAAQTNHLAQTIEALAANVRTLSLMRRAGG